jgi:hypothetical protein
MGMHCRILKNEICIESGDQFISLANINIETMQLSEEIQFSLFGNFKYHAN